MTINLADNDPRDSYTVADGNSQTVFTMSFEIFDDEDLNVYIDGTLQTLTTNYKVSDSASDADAGHTSGTTGHVHMTSAVVASGADKTVVLTRDIEHKRTTDFPASGAFQIGSLNTELDKLIAIAADLNDEIGRSLRLTDYDTSVSLVLPAVDTRKGTVLAFNSTTGAVEAGPQTTNVNQLADITDDIATLADIEDGTDATDAIQTVAGISANVTSVAGISSNVTTVAGISADVTSVAGDASDIGTVAGSISNVNTVAGIDSDVTTVAGISSNVTTVAGKASFITADFVSDLNTLAVADVVADLNTLATSAIVTDMDALANLTTEIDALGDVTADITTVAGIQANVTTVAGISSNVTTVAGDSANIATVAGDSADIATVAGISANVTTVAGANANISTVATNISDVNNFADTYFISATAPSSPTVGDLWFDTTNNIMKVYSSGGFINAGSSVNGTSERKDYVVGTASGSYTGSTTLFPATYDAGFVDVYLNGVKLQPADFTATNGTSVTLASAAQTSDTVSIVGYGTFQLSNFSIGDANNVDLAGLADDQVLQYNSSTSNFEATTFNIADLGDVDTTGLADEQVLQYNSSTSNFEPATPFTTGKSIAMAIVFGG